MKRKPIKAANLPKPKQGSVKTARKQQGNLTDQMTHPNSGCKTKN